MFQFLIGRLKTTFFLDVNSFHGGFQFLIGRLKTMEKRSLIESFIKFQFLIGRLKTTVPAIEPGAYENVSIPHR